MGTNNTSNEATAVKIGKTKQKKLEIAVTERINCTLRKHTETQHIVAIELVDTPLTESDLSNLQESQYICCQGITRNVI